jgi:hypothetical protein
MMAVLRAKEEMYCMITSKIYWVTQVLIVLHRHVVALIFAGGDDLVGTRSLLSRKVLEHATTEH